MRLPVKEILAKLGIHKELHPYETEPFMCYDDARGLTCSAEARMGPLNTDMEIEIQLFYDDDSPELPDDPQVIAGVPIQIVYMQFTPMQSALWTAKRLIVKGEEYTATFHDWEGKGCHFFNITINALRMNEIPDFDALIDKEMRDENGKGGGGGRVGRKSPNVNQKALLGLKQKP